MRTHEADALSQRFYRYLFELANSQFNVAYVQHSLGTAGLNSPFAAYFTHAYTTFAVIVSHAFEIENTSKNFVFRTPDTGNFADKIVAPESRQIFSRLVAKANPDVSEIFQLTLINQDNVLVPALTTIKRLRQSQLLLYFAIRAHATEAPNVHKENAARDLTTYYDVQVFGKLYDYIKGHSEEPLPTLKVLARTFGLNEHKMKSGFKYLYDCSIYQLYMHSRMELALHYIRTTDHALKNIAYMCAFSTYPNFSKAFKKIYGFSPSTLSRKHQGPN